MEVKKIQHAKSNNAFDAYFEVSATENIGIQSAMTYIISKISRLKQFRLDSDDEDRISPGHVSGLFLTAEKLGDKCGKKDKKCC